VGSAVGVGDGATDGVAVISVKETNKMGRMPTEVEKCVRPPFSNRLSSLKA
jgi:hypothetical protein